MTLNILAISDIHGKASSIRSILASASSERIDLITASGDLTHYGSEADLAQMLETLDCMGAPVNYVLGNCDPKEFRRGLGSHGVCLEEGLGGLGPLSIAGAGGSTPTPFGTPFEVDEVELVASLRRNSSRSADGPIMFLVHNPPAGQLVDRTSFGRHVGSRMLSELIASASPLVVQCGHIHEAAGVETIGSSTVFNPGPAMRGRYALVRIDGKNVGVSLRSV